MIRIRSNLFLLIFICAAAMMIACKNPNSSEELEDNKEETVINDTEEAKKVDVDETEPAPDSEKKKEEVEELLEEDFYILEISDELFESMQGKTYKADCNVPREDLRYLHVLHVDFNGETKEGEIVCNKVIAEDLIEIFKELYKNNYQIEKIRLMDEYDADDETAMRDNNSSCFNFRFISNSTKISKHGLGAAVDINTLYNPYIKEVEGQQILEPENAGEYVDRSKDFPHKIDENDLAYKLFTAHGFEWGGSWKSVKDYQHFELPDELTDEIGEDL